MVDLNAPDYIRNFTREQALEEYDYMWTFIEENYPALPVNARMTQVDVEELKATYRTEIENEQNFNFYFYYKTIQNCIGQLGGYGHLWVIDPRMYNMSVLTFELIAQNGEPDFNHYLRSLSGDRTISTYQYISDRNPVPALINTSNTRTGSNLTFSSVDGTPMVSINNFYQENIEQDREQLLQFFANAESEDILIDLTNCQGGSDYYWMENIVAPNIASPLQSHERYVLFKNCTIVQELFGMSEEEIWQQYETDFTKLYELPNINIEDIGSLDFFILGDSYTVTPLSNTPLFNGNIYVLTSATNSSATEGFVSFCSSTKFATLIGKTTAGSQPGVQPIFAPLPYSGIILFMQIDYTLNFDGSCNIEIGTAPDFESMGNELPSNAYFRLRRNGALP